MQEIGIDLDKSRIDAFHRLGMTCRAIVKFLNRKDAENVYSNKKKLKDVDISCLLSDDIQDRNDMTTQSQNNWREVFPEKFYIKESLPALQIFVWFSQREEGRGSDF